MKQTGLEVRPMFHWAPRRIEAHVKLCVLALQVQRTAEIRTGLPGFAVTGHTRTGAVLGKPQISWVFAAAAAKNTQKT
jgi:hypothetical protein